MTDEKNDLQISIIIPVYNRPDEVRELLESIRVQSVPVYEVIIVEDGSTISCKSIACTYKKELNLHYFYKENSGPGQSRNYGVERARGNYFIFLDSDCILPADYMRIVNKYLEHNYSDAFGGPDAAHPNFTRLQKAINFSMTSFLTTGGLRGGNENFHTFEPRSFNMGMSSGVYDATRGFSDMRFGEDIDLSRRIVQHGFKSVLIKDAFVYHKRRSTLRQFFKQIFNSGIARIALYKKYPDSLRFFHFFPAIFTMYTLCTPLLCVWSLYSLIPHLLYISAILVASTALSRSLIVGAYSVITTYIQHLSYGTGFMFAIWKLLILKGKEWTAFTKNFYK